MALSDIMVIAEMIFALLNKLAFIGLCLYFGNLAFKGWKGRRNLIFQIFSIIIIGIICFFGGLVVKDFIGWEFFASEYICSIIVAVICYLLLTLISSGFKVKEKYATKLDIASLLNDIKSLKIQVAKLTKAMEDKKMMPLPLDEEGVKKALAESLQKKGEKNFEIISVARMADAWSCTVNTSKGKKEIIIDAYTGSIAEEKKITSPLEFLYKNPLSTLGIILFISFIAFLVSNVSLTTINAFNQAFDFSFLFESPLPEGCMKASAVLEAFNDNEVTSPINNTALSNILPSGFYLISGKSRAASINEELFYIATSYSSPVTNLGSEITVSNWTNIYEVRVCVLKSDYTLCECIGGSQTDPVFTVPYLVRLGLVEEAIQNIILESLGGMFGGIGGGLFG